MSDQDDSVFGPLICAYTRAMAIADGTLVDVSAVAREAGFTAPVAITHAAYEDCVRWAEKDNDRQIYQDESGRLWDVLYMARLAANCGGSVIEYKVERVPRDGHSRASATRLLKMMIGPGDTAEPVITIMLPTED